MTLKNTGLASSTADTPNDSKKAKTESQEFVAANENRHGLYIVNDGTKKVYLSLGATAVKEKGIPLYPEGGSIYIQDFTGAIYAIAIEGEPLVCWSEV